MAHIHHPSAPGIWHNWKRRGASLLITWFDFTFRKGLSFESACFWCNQQFILYCSISERKCFPFHCQEKKYFRHKEGSTPPKHKSEKDIPTKTQVGRKHSQALREDILKYSPSHTHLRPLVPHLCLLAPIVIKTFFSPKLLTEWTMLEELWKSAYLHKWKNYVSHQHILENLC